MQLSFSKELGRGLRGDEVNIYDYIGGIKNLVWINQVNDEIEDFIEQRSTEDSPVEKKLVDLLVDNTVDSNDENEWVKIIEEDSEEDDEFSDLEDFFKTINPYTSGVPKKANEIMTMKKLMRDIMISNQLWMI